MSPRSEDERERARREREERRAQRADRAASAQRPQTRERVESALARSQSRRSVKPARAAAPPPPPPPPPPQAGPEARPPRPPRRWGRFLVPLAVVLVIAAVAGLWFLNSLLQPGKGDGEGRIVVTIPRGGSLGVIADTLDRAEVISSPFFFKLRARMTGHTSDLKPGRYALRRDMSHDAVLDKLTVGPPRNVINVTIPEGRARSEIAPIVKAAGLEGSYTRATRRSSRLRPARYGAPRSASLEGFLFPATYELKKGASAGDLVAKQVSAFRENFEKVSLSYARRKNLNEYDIVTIASMVEREASIDRERPLIAAVIYNRLKQGIPLGIDATIRFAVDNWTRPLRVSELNTESPYNTRKNQGLPPGPIGNPGLASLEAAARPARVPYLFYVVKPCGNGAHAFSSTDADFQRDVARYNAEREKRGGKSPAKC